MTCPTCGTENSPGAKYCTSCGVPLEARPEEVGNVIYCPSCGSENPVDASLCIRCGASIHETPSWGSRSDSGTGYGEPAGAYGALMPRDLGDLISETFRVYRKGFWGFVVIALCAQIPFLIEQLTPMPVLVSILFLVASFFLFILADGAITLAVAWQYLGRQINVAESYRAAWGRILSLVGGALIFIIALLFSALLSVIIIGIPLFFYLLVKWWFYVQAIMLEGQTGPREALRRSHGLVTRSWWRVFGIGIAFLLVGIGVNIAASIPGFIALAFSPTVSTIFLFVAGVVVLPIGTIGATLVYFDLRIKKEGYTLERMTSEAGN